MVESLQTIVNMLLSGDKDLYEIIFLSLKVSLLAVVIGMLLGIPFGAFLGLVRFPGRGLVVAVVYTLMGLPPVLAGLLIYFIISRYGPLGEWGLLYTWIAMVMAQVMLVTPIITGLTMVAVRNKEKAFLETAVTLGANGWQKVWLVIREARNGIVAAVVTAFGRAIAEVGAVMLVGGNIEHFTRVMTTAIVLETGKGNFELALGLGLVLLTISFVVNGFLTFGVVRYLDRGEEQ
ncbi:MAG: ABC transporter permease [Thermincolia bacterium]